METICIIWNKYGVRNQNQLSSSLAVYYTPSIGINKKTGGKTDEKC